MESTTNAGPSSISSSRRRNSIRSHSSGRAQGHATAPAKEPEKETTADVLEEGIRALFPLAHHNHAQPVSWTDLENMLLPQRVAHLNLGVIRGKCDKLAIIGSFTIGFVDGVVVPFALNLALSLLRNRANLVTAGGAELAAGTLSMLIGRYLEIWSTTHVWHHMNEDLTLWLLKKDAKEKDPSETRERDSSDRGRSRARGRAHEKRKEDASEKRERNSSKIGGEDPEKTANHRDDTMKFIYDMLESFGLPKTTAEYAANTMLNPSEQRADIVKMRFRGETDRRLNAISSNDTDGSQKDEIDTFMIEQKAKESTINTEAWGARVTEPRRRRIAEFMMFQRFGRMPLRGPLFCCGWTYKNVNLDAVWGALVCSLAYFLGGISSLLPYLIPPIELFPLGMGLSILLTSLALTAGGMWKGYKELSWRNTSSRTRHGFKEIAILGGTCLISGGAAVGIVQGFNRIPWDKLDKGK